MLEYIQEFCCPYCDAPGSILFDLTGGKHQEFIQDCETCCRPISIRAVIDENGLSDFQAVTESD